MKQQEESFWSVYEWHLSEQVNAQERKFYLQDLGIDAVAKLEHGQQKNKDSKCDQREAESRH